MEPGSQDQTKLCTGCGREKSLDEFHLAPLGALGRKAKCKICCSKHSSVYYVDKRPEILKQARVYRERNEVTIREKSRVRNRRPKNVLRMAESSRQRRKASPEQFRARKAVQNALRKGFLTKPDRCAACGRGDAPRLVAHHHRGYAKKFWLDIEWICDRCHARLHAAEGAA